MNLFWLIDSDPFFNGNLFVVKCQLNAVSALSRDFSYQLLILDHIESVNYASKAKHPSEISL